MKKFIIGIFMLLFSINSYAMSFKHVQDLYNRILQSNHIVKYPILIMVNNSDNNAGQDGSNLFIYTGLLKDVRNDSEMALVLGHELSHYTLGHWTSNYSNEYAADKLGAQYIHSAGYSICKGAQFLKRLGGATNDHPAGIDRYHRLGCN